MFQLLLFTEIDNVVLCSSFVINSRKGIDIIVFTVVMNVDDIGKTIGNKLPFQLEQLSVLLTLKVFTEPYANFIMHFSCGLLYLLFIS